MKKILMAALLVAASLNVVACATHTTQTDSMSSAAAEERADRAQASANDAMRK